MHGGSHQKMSINTASTSWNCKPLSETLPANHSLFWGWLVSLRAVCVSFPSFLDARPGAGRLWSQTIPCISIEYFFFLCLSTYWQIKSLWKKKHLRWEDQRYQASSVHTLLLQPRVCCCAECPSLESWEPQWGRRWGCSPCMLLKQE